MKQLLFILVFVCFSFSSYGKELKSVSISTSPTPVQYQVEIADTPRSQQQGLMYRKYLAENQGMLFIFPKSEMINMWMKNTFIPLDMLFINQDNTIVKIQENTIPFNEGIISSDIPVLKVLEINAGQVKKNHLQVGMKIQIN